MNDDTQPAEDTPAGEMRLPVRDRVSARVAVLAGLALSIGVTIVTLTESTETSRIGGLG